MIAGNIGRTFLNAWNAKFQKQYSAKEFFDNEFFPLFFDHPKYMLWVQNSPFVQMKKGQTPGTLSHDERLEKLDDLHEKIDIGMRDASIAISFPASEEKEFATTSGLVTDLPLKFDAEEIYLSWIGGGLGVGVSGGYSIFFNNEALLLQLYNGWIVYRKFLNDTTIDLAANKINSWNGQWLNFSNSFDYIENPDFGLLSNCNFFVGESKEKAIDTIFWGKLFFNLSQKTDANVLPAYVYSLGQTNKTIGFIPFILSQGRSLLEIYKKLFGESAALAQKKDYESMFGIRFKRASELGTIGLQALEPESLRAYIGKSRLPDFSEAPINEKKGETPEAFSERKKKSIQKNYTNILLFRTYKTWLLAMITKNKEEDLHYSEEVANALKNYRADAKKRDRANLLENVLLTAKTKKEFLDGLATLIKDVQQEAMETIKTLRDKVHLMTAEDFGYFIVLLRFDYAYLERNS